MKSTIIITFKCLLFASLVSAGCIIGETIKFNLDFSGTKTVEFEFRDELTQDYESGSGQQLKKASFSLQYVDSIFHTLDLVSNLRIDTSGLQMAKISYDFEPNGPKIKNQTLHDLYIEKLPEELKWYFMYKPNQFQRLNENQVMWKSVDVDLFNMDLKELVELAEEFENVETITTLKFPRKIIEVSSNNMAISPDRKMIKSRIDLSKVIELKRDNEVIITFE